jgi:bacteriocin-like protein
MTNLNNELSIDELEAVSGGVDYFSVSGTANCAASGGGLGGLVSAAELGKMLASAVKTLVTSPP